MANPWCFLWCMLAWPGEPDFRFEQVHPAPINREVVEKSPGQTRAILLIHGLRVHSFSTAKIHQANFHDWQVPGSYVVSSLTKHGDVFSFAYSQNVPVEKIYQHPALVAGIRKLNFLGYNEIVVVGHSAGGIIARMFVEDNPEAGVTRVVQICSPNLGSNWARADITVRRDQEPFLHSLTRTERLACIQKRADRKIPDAVQFVCVVGAAGPLGDGLVSILSQWPDDLQAQGIPAVRLPTTHFTVMHSRKTAERIAELVSQGQPRWTDEERTLRKRSVLGAAGN